MKILFVSHHRNGNSGWAKTAIDYILALDKAGYDVVARPLLLNEPDLNIPDKIKKLEQKSTDGCNVLIQNTLPHHWEYNGNFYNIGIFYSETDSIPQEWTSQINLMDEVWVCNYSMYDACIKSGVNCKVRIVYPPVDTEKYNAVYKKPKCLEKLDSDFSFYFIGELHKRKNLRGILTAFHTEFDPGEPVQLVIKTNKFGLSPIQVRDATLKLCEEVKTGLKLYKNHLYKEEIVITDKLTDEEIYGIHTTCDCLVNASFGEAWGAPIIDALGFGKLVVAHKVGGPKDYLDGFNELSGIPNSFTITKSVLEPCYGMLDGFPFLFTGKENWWNPSITELKKRMRQVYSISCKNKLQENAIKTIDRFGYENFSKTIKGIFHAIGIS